MRTTSFLEKYHFAMMISKFPFEDLKTETGQKCSSYQMCCFRKKKKGSEENAMNNIVLEVRNDTTGNPGSVIVPQYSSSKITVFVWGKNIILKFLGNTK